jgi:hypothetical protein
MHHAKQRSIWLRVLAAACGLTALAREGVASDNAFATSPIGAPARSALITGMFCTRIGTTHMRTGDLGFVLPETTLVKDRIWPPAGRQPATPPAEIDDKAVLRGDSMVFVVSLSCPDPGASIGYRLGTDKRYAGPWQVYTTPFEVPADRRFIEVRTHRIGHAPTTTGALLGGE